MTTNEDAVMIRMAAARVPVMLSDGRTARLVCWKPQSGGSSRGAKVRVEFPSGRRATVSIRHLAGILGNDGRLCSFPMPQTPAGEDEYHHRTDVHDSGGGESRRSDLSPAGLLAAHGGGEAVIDLPTRQRALPLLPGVGGQDVDGDRDALPCGASDHTRLRYREAVGRHTVGGAL